MMAKVRVGVVVVVVVLVSVMVLEVWWRSGTDNCCGGGFGVG